MAKATFAGSAGFEFRAEVRRLDRPADTYSLSITTTWSGSSDPTCERRVFQVSTDAAGLRVLADLLRAEAA